MLEQVLLHSFGLLAMIANWQTHNLLCTGKMLTVALLKIPVIEMKSSVLSVTLTFLVI